MTSSAKCSLLFLAALLLGGLSLFATAPAQAQTTVWSATLTVKDLLGANTNAITGCENPLTDASCSSASVLTDDNFVEGGVTYVVTEIQLLASSRNLNIDLDKNVPSSFGSFTLQVGNSSIGSPTVSGKVMTWLNSGLSWSIDDTVSLSLVIPAAPPDDDTDDDDTDDEDTDTEEPSTPEFTLSASPDPAPWDGAGAITVTVEWPTAQDSESVVVHIVEDGLCSWDHFRGNQAIVNIPSGQSRRSEKKENFNLARHEGYYNGEDCNKENKEDCKKCFFTWDASWATGTAGGVFVLSILPPPGSGPPTGGVPPTGGGPSPTGGGPSPGGGGSPPEGPSDPTPPSTPCGESDREYLERFYEASGGDAWHRNENWNSQEPLGEWFRVETDEDGEVISLRLEENNLSGDMPTEELLCLNENTELKELALWDNEDLLGEVPEDLALAVERAALRAIAEMLDLNSEWFEDYEDPFNFEDWYERVTTDDDGRVTELELPGEIPESIRSQFKKRREITITTSDGGCALSPEGSSAFSLFLLTLVVFAVLGRRRAR